MDKTSAFFDNSCEDNLKDKVVVERKAPSYTRKLGQLTMQVDWLKKSEEILGPDYEIKFTPKPFDD